MFFFLQFTAIQILNYAIWWFWLTFLTTARTLYIYAFGFCRRQLAASFGMEMLIRSTLCSPCNYIKRWKQLDNWSLFTVWESQFPTLSRSTFSVWICPSAIFKQGKKFPFNAILEKSCLPNRVEFETNEPGTSALRIPPVFTSITEQ